MNKAINNKMIDPSVIFIDGTHIKASANKRKYQKEQVKKAAKIYEEQLREEVNAEPTKKGQKVLETHIWQKYLDMIEAIRETEQGKEFYAKRKETIERVLADAKEKHAMRYTQHRGLARVSNWVRLKFAAMNLKKMAKWSWDNFILQALFFIFSPNYERIPIFVA